MRHLNFRKSSLKPLLKDSIKKRREPAHLSCSTEAAGYCSTAPLWSMWCKALLVQGFSALAFLTFEAALSNRNVILFVYLFIIILIVISPYNFFSTVQHGDPVTHTCRHSIFAHYHAPSFEYMQFPVLHSRISLVRNVILFIFYLFIFFAISWAAPTACGGSQARGRIGAIATGLHQSHSNSGSKPRLQPTPQVTATPDP